MKYSGLNVDPTAVIEEARNRREALENQLNVASLVDKSRG